MGLQIYTNPDEVDAENVAGTKLDHAAAQGRSPIRREPSLRPARDQSSSAAGLTNIIRARHEMRQARIRADTQAERDAADPDLQIELLESELARLRRLRGGRSTPRRMNQESRARLNRHIREALHDLTNTPISNDVFLTPANGEPAPVEQRQASESVALPRPTRESNLRFEVGTGAPRVPQPHAPQPSIPSPPHSLGETSRGRPVDGPLDTWETTPPLSQDFAPARAARAAMEPDNSAETTTTQRPPLQEQHGLETPPPESYEGSFHPLRRVAHMSPRPLPRNIVDGLGDRHRSPSPTSDIPEEDMWNHLLTAMDNSSRPNADSTSYTSMSDFTRTSRSDFQNSRNSHTTQTSASSFGEIGMSADDTCDLPPGITEDHVRQLREQHQRQMGRVSAPRRYLTDYSEQDENGGSSLSILLREVQESRERRQRRQDELTMLQAIAERQQSQEQIPDEWWAMAGLSTSLGRSSRDL